jgi:hypothetical protein
MTDDSQNPSAEPIKEEDTRAHGKKAPGTLAKGGMSPLADRKDPRGRDESVDAAPANPKATSENGRQATPAGRVGGWINASTGLGKILVPAKDAPPGKRRDERSPTLLVKRKEEKEDLPPAEAPAQPVGVTVEKPVDAIVKTPWDPKIKTPKDPPVKGPWDPKIKTPQDDPVNAPMDDPLETPQGPSVATPVDGKDDMPLTARKEQDAAQDLEEDEAEEESDKA